LIAPPTALAEQFLALVVLNTLVICLFLPFAAVDVAFLARANGWGLFDVFSLLAWRAIVSMFDHGNVRLSARRFILRWWAHVFRTDRGQPVLGHHGMSLGSDRFREPGEPWRDRTLWQALRRDLPARDRSPVAT
jgi:hypothetical protein